jgi:serine-type D-Ala-D-Ala carboxypeptidase/endopeptidase
MRLHLILVGVGLFAGAATAQAVATDNPRKSRLDKAVDGAAAAFFFDSCHAGISIAITDDRRRAFYDYGTTSRAEPRLPTKRSLYEIGSATKAFTGSLAAKAVLDRRMSLDGDFRAYLAEAYPNLELNGKPITLHTLADHTSGLPRDIPDNGDLFRGNPDFENLPYLLLEREKSYDRNRYLTELHDVRLATEPGAKMSYSNIGIKLIGFGLENVNRLDFQHLLARDILRPLGMADTTLVPTRAQRSRLVQGYLPGGKPAPHILPNAGAAGGLISSTEDMIKFAEWQLGESDPVIAFAHRPLWGSPKYFAAGLIWDMALTPSGDRKIWHSGGVFGMSSQLILFPDRKRAYVLLANDACPNTQSQLERIALDVEKASGGGR